MWELIITVGLQLVGWILGKNKENKEMQELFYKFVEKQQKEYLNSANMRLNAQARMKAISEKLFEETK